MGSKEALVWTYEDEGSARSLIIYVKVSWSKAAPTSKVIIQ